MAAEGFTVDGWPFRSIERLGLRIELVGLMAMLTVMSCPVEMPPSTPPALLLAKPLRRELVAMLGAALGDAGEAGADLDALTALMPIIA